MKSAKQKVKESIMKNRKRGVREQGITLLALVITVIIIIILATVTISFLFGENGLITRAQQARLQHEIETARETLTMVLGDAFVEKKINPDYDQNDFLDEFIRAKEPTVYLAESAIGLDGHIFGLDRSVPELGEYQGELTGPRIQEMTITKESTSTVTVVVTAENAEGATYEYSYKKSTEGEDSWVTVETDENSNTCTIENLEDGETYDIKVVVKADTGTVERIESVQMGEMPTGTVTFTPAQWVGGGTATTTISTSAEGFRLRYKIDEGEWTEIASGGTISNLQHGNTVYGQLYDGSNTSGEADATYIVTDENPPEITSVTASNITFNSITVDVTASDNESGIASYTYTIEGQEPVTTTEGSHTFTGLTSETDYNIQVTVTDRAEHSVTEPTTVTTLEFTVGQTPEPEQGTTELADEDKENGVIEIKWLSGTSNNVSSTPNAPVIKEDLPAGTTMELVRYTGEGSTEQERWVPGTEYSYEPGIGSNDNTSSKWANARVTKDGIDSYFVWIPRYAYRIIYFDSAESKKAYREGTLTEKDAVVSGQIIGYSDSRGIVDAQGRKIKDVASTTKTMVSKDYFMTHPAFMNGTGNNYENGEWSTDIAGIWIGKYETSRSNATSSSSGSGTTLKVQPNVLSYRNVSIGSMYTYSLAYSEELQSHMLKNSEWGAVAYLTESKYGRNGTEIGFSDEGYITGGGADNAYATTNQDQSTTGNVYGIYDMRGGAYEYVASYYNGSTSLSNGSSFASNGGPSTKYTTAYTGTSESTSYKYGDATYETSGWHSDDAYFVFSSTPFFNRGGNYSDAATYAGVFYFGRYDGRGNSSYHSFRVSLVV